MMNRKLIKKFQSLVEEQANNKPDAIRQLKLLNVQLDDGCCIFNLYGEWTGAFSFLPGRTQALQYIRPLANKVDRMANDDTGVLFDTEEWKELVRLRGPVESVMLNKCSSCHTITPAMGTSGFYDASGLICVECGNVYFKSYGDETVLPQCSCGGHYQQVWPCPRCRGKKYTTIKEISPYEYFATHQFIRGKDA
jgi:hypothetical protein